MALHRDLLLSPCETLGRDFRRLPSAKDLSSTAYERCLALTAALRTYGRPDRYTVAVKVTDIFRNDTMKLVPVKVA